MANIDWGSALDWGWGGRLYQPTNNWGGGGPDMSSSAANFAATQQNADLLAKLGYTGQSLTDAEPNPYIPGWTAPQSWTPGALSWLDSQGYQLGVGHSKGSSSQGRAEFWGLLDPSGKYVSGQTDPTQTMSDSTMDLIAPYLLMLPAVNGVVSAAGAAGDAAGVGAASTASAAPSAGSLGSAADTVSALGPSWSPSALGLTDPIVPAVSSGDLAAIGSGIPSVTPSITDAALQGALRGAVTGGVKGIATGQNPIQSALQGALGGAVTGGIGGGVNAINPDGAGLVNNSISGGITSAVAGGNPLLGAAGGALNTLANNGLQSIGASTTPSTPTTTGNGMDLGSDGWFTNFDPNNLNLTTDIAGNVISPADTSGAWTPQLDNWFLNALNGGSTDTSNGLPSWLPSVLKGLTTSGASSTSAGTSNSGLGSLLGGLLGNSNGSGSAVGALLGGLLGASTSKSGTTTSTKAPWEAAQPYLKGLLSDADTLRQDLAQNPFTAQQTNAYNQAYSGLDQARAAVPGLMNWSQNAMQRQSTTPSYAQLFSQVKPG